jgi:hypothetical protein
MPMKKIIKKCTYESKIHYLLYVKEYNSDQKENVKQ